MNEKNKAREAIPCGRFSSDKQEAGDSKSRQAKSFARVYQRWELSPSTRYNIFDAGKSAFHGAHLASGAELGKFLAQVKAGTIMADGKGRMPVLCYEAVDRLTRLHPMEANDLFKGLVNAGIAIVFDEADLWIDKETIGEKWIMLQVLIENAWRYSQRLSNRIKSAKQTMRDNGTRFKSCPKWIALDEKTGDYVKNQPRWDTLRKACLMAIDGHGASIIGRMLGIKNWEGLPWIFSQRTLIGEYQPKKRNLNGKGKNREKVGDVKKGFYPPLLSTDEFVKLQASVASRKKHHAKTVTKGCTNLFTMLVNPEGEKLVIRQLLRKTTKGQPRAYLPFLTSALALKRLGTPFQLVDYATVETCLLNCLCEHITPAMLNPVQAKANEQADACREKIAEYQDSIGQWEQGAMEGAKGLSKLISKTTEKMEILQEHLESLCQKAAHNQPADLESAVDLIDTIKSKEGADLLDCRIRLKALIASMVKKVIVQRNRNDPKNLNFLVALNSGITLTGDGGEKWNIGTITVWEEMAG